MEGIWPKTLRRWLHHRRSLEWLAAALCATPRTILTMDDVTVLAVKVLARARVEGYAPEPQEQPLSADTLGWGLPTDMAGGVVPTSSFAVAPEPMIVDAVVPSPPSAPMVNPMDAKAAWLAGRRGLLRWIA